MRQSRDSAHIRADAIAMAIKKGLDGCEECAQGYLNLARKHGATEEEIERAITATPEVRTSDISRSALLKIAAIGAARMAALTAAGGFLPQLAVRAAAAAAGPPDAYVAWILGTAPVGASQLLGVTASGGVVGSIDASNKQVLRSADNTLLYVLSARTDGATSTTIVAIYSATTGALQSTIQGQTLPLGSPTGFDALAPVTSDDGRYLAVLHQTRYVVTPGATQATKLAPDGTTTTLTIDDVTIINGVEIIDVQASRSLTYVKLDASPDSRLGGQIFDAPEANRFYVFTSDRNFDVSATVVTFDGATLRPDIQVKNGQSGHVLPPIGPQAHATTRIRPTDQSLVHLDGPTVQWVDLRGLTLAQQLDIPVTPHAKEFPWIALFSPDGNTLYAVNTARATVQAVDVGQRALRNATTLPPETQSPVAPDMRAATSVQGASLSPDGTRLYLIDGRGGDGIWVLSLPDLQVVSHWLPGQYVRAVWPAPDGLTVYASGMDTDLVYALGTDGHVESATHTGTTIQGFFGPGGKGLA